MHTGLYDFAGQHCKMDGKPSACCVVDSHQDTSFALADNTYHSLKF